MTDRCKVLIADDHQMMIDGILSILQGQQAYEVIATAHDGEQAWNHLQQNQPNLLITDINMPELGGIELTKRVREEFPDIKVLVLTMYNDSEIVNEIMAAGAHGYILKNTGKEELLQAINELMSDKTFYSKAVIDTMIDNVQKAGQAKEESHLNSASLTSREKEIVRLIVGERTNLEIAEELFISPRTVETHRKNIIRKTGVKNVAGLIRYAHEHNIV